MSDLPPAGSIVRRTRDGMLGLVDKHWSYQPSATYRAVICDVYWLGEWTKGDLYREKGAFEQLTGREADAARARFARLFCTTCGGSGKTDPWTTCPVPVCKMGRLLGVEPSFDAAYAAYERLISSEMAREAKRYSGGSSSRPEDLVDRQMVLKYPSRCTDCGRGLPAGEPALGAKAKGAWSFRCLDHAA